MGRTSTAAFREALLARKREVLEKLSYAPDPEAEAGRETEDDQAWASHDEFVAARLNQLDYESLRLVEAALERLESGEFGACAACGGTIPRRRLAAVPWARYCVACEETGAPPPEPTTGSTATTAASDPRRCAAPPGRSESP